MLRVFSGRRPLRRRPSVVARVVRFCGRLILVALALTTLVLLALHWLDLAEARTHMTTFGAARLASAMAASQEGVTLYTEAGERQD